MVSLRPESGVFYSAHRSVDCAPIDFSNQKVIVFFGDLIASVCRLCLDAFALWECEVMSHVYLFVCLECKYRDFYPNKKNISPLLFEVKT